MRYVRLSLSSLPHKPLCVKGFCFAAGRYLRDGLFHEVNDCDRVVFFALRAVDFERAAFEPGQEAPAFAAVAVGVRTTYFEHISPHQPRGVIGAHHSIAHRVHSVVIFLDWHFFDRLAFS